MQRHIEYMPLASIPRALRNPKDHDFASIRTSIQQFGCIVAGELDDRTGRLVVGHGRLEVLEGLEAAGESPPEGIHVAEDGTWLIPIVRGWSSRSDADAEAYIIANNHTGEKGGWMDAVLVEMLGDIGDVDPDLMAATGYSPEDLAALNEALEADQYDGGDGDDPEGLPDPGDAESEDRPQVWGVVATCENEEQQVELLERLTREGYQVRALM